ncbi:MAG TPA: signal peptidase II [Candidatus Limnocylindrales bacterium]|nr:signal peptidase II [Candidatus Limnocylindrales bacterium]
MSQTARRHWLIFFGVAIVVVLVDQATKLWVDANFLPASVHAQAGANQPTPIIGDLVRIAKNYNTGGIFGLFGDSALILALSSTVVIGLIVVYQAREGTREAWPLSVALGLLLGGAIGNFIDRVRLGAVIDWVDTGIGTFRWYTFNVADSAIFIALVLLFVMAVFGDRITRRLEHRPAS